MHYSSDTQAASNAQWLILSYRPSLQVQVALPAERPAQHAHHASIADEVAALNAEMCAALSGLVGEDSPEKGHRCGGGVGSKHFL